MRKQDWEVQKFVWVTQSVSDLAMSPPDCSTSVPSENSNVVSCAPTPCWRQRQQFCLPEGRFHSPQRKRARSQPCRPLQAQGRHGPTSIFRLSMAAAGVADPGAEKAGRWQHGERLELCGTRDIQVCPTGWSLLSSSQLWPWLNQVRTSGHLTLKESRNLDFYVNYPTL